MPRRHDRRWLAIPCLGVAACNADATTTGDERPAAADVAVAPTPSATPQPVIAAAAPVAAPPAPVEPAAALELHVVATRRGPIAVSVGRGVELALGGVEPIALRTTEPLVREPRFLEGMSTLTEGLNGPTVDLVRFGGRWPDEATLVARVGMEYAEGSFTRAMHWNGSTWERDDPVVRGLKHYWMPIGPFELGTTLVLPAIEHTSPGKRGWIEALERAKPKQLVRRLVDGTTTPGPPLPAEEYARYASTPDGWVFAGAGRIAMWSPGATAWHSADLPGIAAGWIEGFVATASDDVYLYGVRTDGEGGRAGGYIAHFDGKTWQAMDAPPCTDGIRKLVPGRPTSWAYCVNENHEPRRPPTIRELWRTDAGDKWQRVALTLDPATSRVRVDALAPNEERPPLDEARPRTTDVALAADGTLWVAMSDHDGVWRETSATWTLARSSTAAQVLALPSDAELFPPSPR